MAKHHDILIICHNDTHLSYVKEAFILNAYYCIPHEDLCGMKFKKVIIFKPWFLHGLQLSNYMDWFYSSVVNRMLQDNEGVYWV